MHWFRIEWLLALPLLLAFACWRINRKTTATEWEAVCDPHLLKPLLSGSQGTSLKRLYSVMAAAWVIAVIALAGPSFKQVPAPVFDSKNTQVILFDLSADMFKQDISPSRLTRAKYKLNDLLAETQGTQTGLIAFSGEAFVAAPITTDNTTLTTLIPDLHPTIMPTRGFDIATALKEADRLITHAGINQAVLHVFMTQAPNQNAIQLAGKLAQKNIRTNAYVFNNDPVVFNQAMQLSRAGQGKALSFSHSDTDIAALKASLNPPNETQGYAQTSQLHWLDQGRLFILPLLILAALSFRRGWRERIYES